MRYVIEETTFVKRFRSYPDGRRRSAGRFEELYSILSCPKCGFTREPFAFSGSRYPTGTIGFGWAIFPLVSGDEVEVVIVDFCNSTVVRFFAVKKGDWRFAGETVMNITNAHIIHYPLRTMTLEFRVN